MDRATVTPTCLPSVSSSGRSTARRMAASLALASAVAVAAAGCTSVGDSAATIVKSPIRGTAEVTGFATTTPEAKDFVRQTRNPDADFMPVGVTPPARSQRAKTPDEIKAMEADLEGTLQQHNAVSGRAASGEKFKSAAGTPDKSAPAPRGADRFLIPAKPKPAQAPAGGTTPKAGDQTKS